MLIRMCETIAFQAISTPTTTRELAKEASPTAITMLTAEIARAYSTYFTMLDADGVGRLPANTYATTTAIANPSASIGRKTAERPGRPDVEQCRPLATRDHEVAEDAVRDVLCARRRADDDRRDGADPRRAAA